MAQRTKTEPSPGPLTPQEMDNHKLESTEPEDDQLTPEPDVSGNVASSMDTETPPPSKKRKNAEKKPATSFTVQWPMPGKQPKRPTKRRKLNSEKSEDGVIPNLPQPSPFENTIIKEYEYRVEPMEDWVAMNVYKRATIQDEPFESGDYIYVKSGHDDEDDDLTSEASGDWVAKILEIRARDEVNVFIRVYWMYRPEDLPGGRRQYHARNELIASNAMDIINAQTVNGKAFVLHWIEEDDKSEILDPARLFWRQAIAFNHPRKQSKLSELPKYCFDKKPCNPDEVLIQCDSCEKWLHSSCIEKDAVEKEYQKHGIAYTETPSGKTPKKSTKKSGQKLLFRAKFSTQGGTKLFIEDHRSGKSKARREIPPKCLLCGELVDQGKHANPTELPYGSLDGPSVGQDVDATINEMQTSEEDEDESSDEVDSMQQDEESADSVVGDGEEEQQKAESHRLIPVSPSEAVPAA